jgi:hypothetical protein
LSCISKGANRLTFETSFSWQVWIWRVLFVNCACVHTRNFLWQLSYWFSDPNIAIIGYYNNRSLINCMQVLKYFAKFSLLTHTDEQLNKNKFLYFANFSYDKYTCWKASINKQVCLS